MGWDPREWVQDNVVAPAVSTWEDATSGYRNFISDPLGGLRQGGADIMGGIGLGDNNQRPPQATPEDPRITETRKRLSQEAKDFRSGLSQYKNEKFSLAGEPARQELVNTNKNIRQNANQRGLLFSGMREGQESGSRARMASILASQRAEINKEAEDLAAAKDQTAANVGLAGYDAAIKRADDTYNQALTNEIARRRGLAQIGEGVGYGFGAYYGKKAGDADPKK